MRCRTVNRMFTDADLELSVLACKDLTMPLQ